MEQSRRRKKEVQDQETSEVRWSHILAEVTEEYRTEGTWWQRLGTFVAWAAGIAVAGALLVTLLVFIVDLFSADRLFSALTISNWIFWVSAILMGVGMLSPVAGDIENLAGRQEASKDKKEDKKEKDANKARKKIRRVYNPWRWRLWAAALFSFGLSILVGTAV